MTMDTIIDQQAEMDEALVPHAQRLRIRRRNFRLLSDIKSKESTLQFVHDVLRLCPFFKDFLVIADVEHKKSKKSNEMYYPQFMKVIIHHFMSKDPSIPRRNKVNWHYVRDDHMFSTIKLELHHPSLQQTHISRASGSSADEGTGSIPGVPDVPIDESKEELFWNFIDDEGDDNEAKDGDGDEKDDGVDGEEGDGDNDDEGKDGDGDEKDDGDDGKEGDGDDDDEDDNGEEGDDDDDQEVIRDDDKDDEKNADKEGGDDEQEYNEEQYDEETRDEESFNPISKTPENSDDEGNGEEDLGLNVVGEEGHDEEEEEDELYIDVNINQGRGIQATLEVEDSHMTLTPVHLDGQQQSSSVSSQFVTSMLNPTLDVGIESIFETTSQMDVQTLTSMAHLPMTAPTMTPSTIATITTTSQAPILPTTWMHGAVKVAVQIQFDHLRDEAQRENDEFLKTVDENMQKIIKEQVKEQVKVQVSQILPRIEQIVNDQLEAEVLTRSSSSSKTSYAVAADLSEMELKKILIEKMKGNKSIQRSDEQRNLYKALVEAYKSNKIILDTYGETVTLKRRRDDDADKDEERSAGPDWGSKRRREGKEHESASAPSETATRSAGRLTHGSQSRQTSASEYAFAEEPMQTTCQMEEPSHLEFDTGAEDEPVVQTSQHPEWFSQQQKPPSLDRDWNKTVLATHGSIQPKDFSNFLINRLKVDTLTPKLLAGPTYKLMKGSCKCLVELEYRLEEVFKATTNQLDWVNPKGQQYLHNLLKPLPLIPNNRGRRVIPFEHFINNDLESLRGGASSRKYTTSITKTKAVDYGHIKWIENLVPRTMWIEEPIGYDKHALWGVSHCRRKRKLTNLRVEERFAFNVSLRMFTRRIMIQRHVEDLQLSVESYQKKLNLTKPDSYRSDLKRKEAYTAYSNPRGFIYQNKDKKNRNTKLLSGIEDSHHVPSDAMHNPSQPLKVKKTLFQNPRRYTHFYRLSHSELVEEGELVEAAGTGVGTSGIG
nr:hypothetical protein [Tanacetum cinerariifolium]